MKRWFILLFSFAIVFTAKAGFPLEMTAQTGFHFDWWKDSRDNKGSQFYTPFKIDLRHQDFSLSILTAEAYTHINPHPGTDRSLTHLLDTKVNFSYEVVDKLPIDLLIGLDFNLPTGKTGLKRFKELVLLPDPDLVSITTFGEGFNINPTLSLAKEWDKWVAGIGVGYVWRGEYDFFWEIARNYDPGNIFTLNAEIRHDVSSRWVARIFGNYTWYGKDKVNDIKFHQEGAFYLVGFGVHHEQETWDADITLRSIFRDKSKYQLVGDPSLFPIVLPSPREESRNSHGNEVLADVSFRYFLNDTTTLRTFLQGLYITKNDYPSTSIFFIGHREKLSVGLGIKRRLLKFLEGELYTKGFLMHREEAFSLLPQFRSQRNARGFSIGLLLTGTF